MSRSTKEIPREEVFKIKKGHDGFTYCWYRSIRVLAASHDKTFEGDVSVYDVAETVFAWRLLDEGSFLDRFLTCIVEEERVPTDQEVDKWQLEDALS